MPTTNGREQVFNEGIKNNDSRPADTTANLLVTKAEDGTYGSMIQLGSLQPQSINLPIAHTTIIAWGDSLTQGAGGLGTTYPTTISSITGFTVTNKGIGGETSTQIKDRFVADTVNYDKSVIIWAGRNNYLFPDTVKTDIATMVANLTHTRYLIVGIINGNYPSEYKDQSGWETITQLNRDLQETYGEKFVDIRPYLVSLHNNSAQDLIDFANDIPPDSLRVDSIHLSATGYALVGQYLNQRLGILFEQEGYLQSKDFNGYLNQYQVMHLVGNENVAGVKTFTNTTNTISNGIVVNNSGATTAGWGLGVYNTAGGNGIYESNTAGGTGLYIDNSGTSGFGVRVITSGSATAAYRADISGTSRGTIYNNSGSGRTTDTTLSSNTTGHYVSSSASGSVGFWSTGIGIHLAITNGGSQNGILGENQSTGVFASINSATASTSDLIQLKKNSVVTSKFDHNGILTTPSPIISSETANTIASFDGTKNLKSLPLATYPSLTELSYVKGVTSAIQAQIDAKAPLSSPALTGTPTATTASPGTNTTQLATTAFVQDALTSSSADIQDIVDAPTKTALIDSGNSQITMFDGSADNRTFSGIVSDGVGNSSDFNFQNNNCFIRNEVPGAVGLIGVSSGLPRFSRTKPGTGTTETGIEEPVASTTINTPAISVAGTYLYAVQPKEYTVSALPTPTGSDSRFAIVTDATAPTYLGALTGGGAVVCPVFYNGSAWVAH